MKKISAMLFTTLLLASGCSTIVNGTSQTVFVETNTHGSATCDLHDSKSKYQVSAPGNVVVKRGDGPLYVSCKSATHTGNTVVGEALDPTVVWAGHGGFLVDSITGAYQVYPEQIVVPMVLVQTSNPQ